jgi:aspartate aminotransferase-like enzyme
MKEKQLLMLPGPTPVPQEVLQALARPMINHRGPEFKGLLDEASEGLKEVFCTRQDVLILTGAGTGAMEAAVSNFVSPGDRVLVVSIGSFGDRFASIAQRFGAQVEKLDFAWGAAADPAVLSDRIRADINKKIKAVFVTHNETSTGVTNDIPALRAAVGDHPALFIVDAVSSLGAMSLETDNWNLDVVIAGSQKSFMIPPGLSFACVSPRAWDVAAGCTNARYYWDLAKARESAAKGQTPFTPAIPLVAALVESLRMIGAEGLPSIFSRHRRLREMTRRGVRALGLELLATDAVASAAVTAVLPPPDLEANTIRKMLLERFNVVVAGGQGKLDNKIFRIGHLGYVQGMDIIAVMAALEMTLTICGHKVELGSGVRAAQAVAISDIGR